MNNHIKTVVNSIINECKENTFEEIVYKVHSVSSPVKGIGRLGVYDLSNGICKKYGINVNRVYIVGPGPKRAVKLLGLSVKLQRFGNFKMHYVEIYEVIAAFKVRGLSIITSNNGDDYETYICEWQKGVI